MFQFRLSALMIVTFILVILIGLALFIINDRNSDETKQMFFGRSIDLQHNELHVLEQQLQKLEEELQKNQNVLDQVKVALKDLAIDTSNAIMQSEGNEVNLYLNTSLNSVKIPEEVCILFASPKIQTDLHMLDMYNELKFDNPNGGVWKQGWNIQYDDTQWNSEQKLKIFVVPHSHNDPGWLKTFDKYFTEQTQNILNNMLSKLKFDTRRKFIWSEISYFSLWWNKISHEQKQLVKSYLDHGQLEITTGGWVMTDEAVSHYYAMLEQMVEGHQWLLNYLEYRPKNGWAIDPFGLSPTMAYLLKRMDLENMVIQRVHYSVKKNLALHKNLEFLWRQEWDINHTTDILCHMMPFYSYDVPHTCGPDPKVCCQFDFKRLPGGKMKCPWRIPPVPINDKNVADRAKLLIDQYKKKAQLYRTNVLLVPLGDDFRYEKALEWDQQFQNYQRLFDFMNNKEDWNVEAQFGTLDDYFTAVREESGVDDGNLPVGFPSLAGDFFTYADRDDHYWSGFFTSRPFYKNMDRVLEAHLRGAEILFAFMYDRLMQYPKKLTDLMEDLVESRRTLGLFQHHDAITGTSKDTVVNDYASRMFMSLKKLQHIITVSSLHLLSGNEIHSAFLQMDEIKLHHSAIPEKLVIQFTATKKSHKLIIYNSLGYLRKELVFVYISTPFVEVLDLKGKIVPSQVSPVFKGKMFVEEQFELCFLAEIHGLSLQLYTVHLIKGHRNAKASITLFNFDSVPESLVFPISMEDTAEKFSIQSHFATAFFSGEDGMLQHIILKQDKTEIDMKVKFLMYGTRKKGRDRSGAYLFLPDTQAQLLKYNQPCIRVLEGPLYSEVTVFIPNIEHHIKLKSSPGIDGNVIEIYNVVDISQETNKEIIMRIHTNILNHNNEFYTDLNGFQMVKRQTFEKLPIQANVYPMSTMAYFQDNTTRFSLLSGQPLGVACLKRGWIEVFLDRRLNQDDNRGLQQGVTDNKRTPSSFRLLIEKKINSYSLNKKSEKTLSYPSLFAHHALLSLLHPVFIMLLRSNQGLIGQHTDNLNSNFRPLMTSLPCDVHLLNLRVLTSFSSNSAISPSNATGMFLHRLGFECGYKTYGLNCSVENGKISLDQLFPYDFGPVMEETSLTLTNQKAVFSRSSILYLPPMEIVAYKLYHR